MRCTWIRKQGCPSYAFIAADVRLFVPMNAWRCCHPRLEKKMINEETFRVLLVNLTDGKSEPVLFGSPSELLGGSGLAAGLFASYGIMDAPADHPDQPLIFAIGPLTA